MPADDDPTTDDDDPTTADAERTADGSEDAPGRDSEDAPGRDSEDAPGRDSEDAPGRDPDVEGEGENEFPAAPDRAAALREIAEDVRGESSESEQLANVLYRTSDIYDPDEDTTPEEVMQNVKFILEVKERGGLGR